MVLEVLSNFLVSLASLLWGSFLCSIPVFLVVFFVGQPLHAWFREKNGKSWVLSAFLASYVIVFALLILAFFFPVWEATNSSTIGIPPEAIQLTPVDLLGQFVFGLVKLLLVSALVGALLLPFVFLGAFVRDSLEPRIPIPWLRLFAAVFCSVLVAWIVLLFLLPWVIPGLLYLLYWG